MKQSVLAICLLYIGTVYGQITNNTELFGNSDFSNVDLFANGTSGFATSAASDASIRGKWYAGATEIASYNVDGFMNNILNGYFDAFMPFDAALVYNNFLAQVPAEQLTTGRYHLSLKAKGTAPFYIKISSVAAMGTELGSILRNPSSGAIVKQTTPDYNTYSIKVTPTEDWATYSADLDITLNTNYVRVFIVFPKTGVASLDDISLMRTKDLPTTFYVRPSANATAWSGLTGIDPEQILSTDAISFAGTNTYYLAGGNYTTSSTIAITTGKIYGGFSGSETSIDLEARPVSDLDQNGITEPWEFTHTSTITSTIANSKYEQAGTQSRLMTISGNGGEVDGVTFTDHNYLTYGGAIVIGQVNGNPTTNTPEVAGKMTRCTVKKMKGGTGVVMLTNNMSVIDRCLIEDNTGTASYGAVYLNRFGGIVSNSVIRNNKAKTKGGAIYAGNVLATGGVHLKGVVSNCVIYNNTADQNGGAIVGVAGVDLSGLEIVNSTIVNNTTTAPGLASVELENNGLVVNSIILNDPLDELSVNTVSNYVERVAYGSAVGAALYPATQNISGKSVADFNFVNPSLSQGYLGLTGTDYEAMRKSNYKILSTSSAAYVSNATIPESYLIGGTGASVATRATVPATDILGVTRSNNMTIGAYFYNPASGIGEQSGERIFAYGTTNTIEIKSEPGKEVQIYTVSGQLLKTVTPDTDQISVKAAPGFYVIVSGTQKHKVAVNL